MSAVHSVDDPDPNDEFLIVGGMSDVWNPVPSVDPLQRAMEGECTTCHRELMTLFERHDGMVQRKLTDRPGDAERRHEAEVALHNRTVFLCVDSLVQHYQSLRKNESCFMGIPITNLTVYKAIVEALRDVRSSLLPEPPVPPRNPHFVAAWTRRVTSSAFRHQFVKDKTRVISYIEAFNEARSFMELINRKKVSMGTFTTTLATENTTSDNGATPRTAKRSRAAVEVAEAEKKVLQAQVADLKQSIEALRQQHDDQIQALRQQHMQEIQFHRQQNEQLLAFLFQRPQQHPQVAPPPAVPPAPPQTQHQVQLIQPWPQQQPQLQLQPTMAQPPPTMEQQPHGAYQSQQIGLHNSAHASQGLPTQRARF